MDLVSLLRQLFALWGQFLGIRLGAVFHGMNQLEVLLFALDVSTPAPWTSAPRLRRDKQHDKKKSSPAYPQLDRGAVPSHKKKPQKRLLATTGLSPPAA